MGVHGEELSWEGWKGSSPKGYDCSPGGEDEMALLTDAGNEEGSPAFQHAATYMHHEVSFSALLDPPPHKRNKTLDCQVSQCLDATPPLENRASIILSFELMSTEKWSGFLFFSLSSTVASVTLHLTFCVRCTKEKCILLGTPGTLHSSLCVLHLCLWKIHEWQTDNVAIYVTKDSTHSPSPYRRVLHSSEFQLSGSPSTQTGCPCSYTAASPKALGGQGASSSFP